MPLNNRSRSPPYPSHLLFHNARLYFGIDCQTTLQVKEKLVSRLPVEIYVQLRCLIVVSGYWAT